MLDKAQSINQEMLKKFRKNYDADKVAKVLECACSKTTASQVVFVPKSKVGLDHQFSIDIKTSKVTNQKSSGRCWLFAGTNVLREIVIKKCNMNDFELSQNYMAFYDKLEKINYALECIIDLIDRDSFERNLYTILRYPVADGGQWDMFKSLIKKYGVCPKNVMDETYASSNTRDSSFIINTTIRKFASSAKRLFEEGKASEIAKLKEETLEKLYRAICVLFGQPVEKFDFEYVDKDGGYHLDKDITPKEFYDKYVGLDIDDYVSIVNSPTKDKPFYETFTVDYIGNVIGGDDIFYLNLPMSELKELVLEQLKTGEVVWFGSDCSKFGNRDTGVWCEEQFDYETGFGLNLKMDKADMLDYSQSAMNHAMVITGVNLVNDLPTKWKIENSWGADIAYSGYYTATDGWFDDFVYQAVINKKFLNEKQKESLNKTPHHLTPWDPMGTLAK